MGKISEDETIERHNSYGLFEIAQNFFDCLTEIEKALKSSIEMPEDAQF